MRHCFVPVFASLLFGGLAPAAFGQALDSVPVPTTGEVLAPLPPNGVVSARQYPGAVGRPFARHRHISFVPVASGVGVSRESVMERAEPGRMYFIDMLFFYTDGFEDEFALFGSSMHHEVWQSVSLLNAAMANSKVNVTFRIVGLEQLPGMPDDQDVAHRMIVEDEHARRRRDVLGADLVYALVDDRSDHSSP